MMPLCSWVVYVDTLDNKAMKKEKQQIIEGFKGFNEKMECLDFKFEEGKEYTHHGKVKACESGFHFCQMPLDVFNYYPPNGQNQYHKVEGSGSLDFESSDSKVASEKLKISTKLNITSLFKLYFELLWDRIKSTPETNVTNTIGYKAHANTSGYYAHANTSGEEAIASALGVYSKSKAEKGWIIIVDWQQDKEYNWFINAIHNAKVGRDSINGVLIQPDVQYWFEKGELKF